MSTNQVLNSNKTLNKSPERSIKRADPEDLTIRVKTTSNNM